MPSSAFAYILLAILGAALLGIYIYIGVQSSKLDTAAEVNKHITIVSSVTAVLTALYGVLTYIYFSINVNQVTPFLLISNTVTLAIALIALSISSLRATSS